MTKTKVYLSKSNSGTVESLIKVRELLTSKYNVEILEHHGGRYDSNLIDDADIVLILPYTLPKAFNYHFHVGRGQWDQILAARENEQQLFAILTFYDAIYVAKINTRELIDENWTTKYGRIICKDMILDLANYIVPVKSDILYKNAYRKPMLALYKLLKTQK